MKINVLKTVVVACCIIASNISQARLLFEENFDNQADWEVLENDLVVPPGWDYGRTSETWHPASVPGSQPSMLISGDDPSKVFGEQGKSFITYSESFNDLSNNGFTSDGFITKEIPPSDEVFVEFQVKFQPGWAADSEGGQIKLFRALSWDGIEPRSKFFSDGNSAPIYIYDWVQNSFGVRHFHAFRCDDQRTTYFCTSPAIQSPPRSISRGDMNANFTADLSSITPAPQFRDQITGEVIPLSGTIFHNNLLGDVWNKMEFYLKLNSAPSVTDGILQVWLNGQQIIDMNEIPWIGDNGNMNAKWNNISFGGNDRYHFNLDDAAPIRDRERWYAIDNIKIYNSRPTIPNPPSNLSIN